MFVFKYIADFGKAWVPKFLLIYHDFMKRSVRSGIPIYDCYTN